MLSTHILEEVDAVCTRATIIAGGRIVSDGTPEELLQRSRMHNALRLGLAVGEDAGGEDVAETFEAVPGVARAEAGAQSGGVLEVILFPAGSAPLAGPAGETARANGWEVTEMQRRAGPPRRRVQGHHPRRGWRGPCVTSGTGRQAGTRRRVRGKRQEAGEGDGRGPDRLRARIVRSFRNGRGRREPAGRGGCGRRPMTAMANVLDHLQARAVRLLRDACRLRLPRHLRVPERHLRVLHRQLLRARAGRSPALLPIPPLAVPVPHPRAVDAAVGGGASRRHHRAPVHAPGHHDRGRAREVSRGMEVHRDRALAHVPALDHRQLPRATPTTGSSSRAISAAC